MKIQKFNENDNLDPLLQGEWNDQKFSNIHLLSLRVINIKNHIEKLLIDYLRIIDYNNIDPFCPNLDEEFDPYISYYVYTNKKITIDIQNFNEDEYRIDIEKERFDDLLLFLNNKEEYRNIKKYNI